jgi:diguanylate cyclase (GGDEF)-like protein
MTDRDLTVYGDLNCPFCFTLHERLVALGQLAHVAWRDIEHAPHIAYDPADLRSHAELNQEVNRVRQAVPETGIVVPASRPNSGRAIALVAQAHEIDPRKAIRLRTAIYRSLWLEGRDFSDPDLLDTLRTKVGLPPLTVSSATRERLARWRKDWEEGPASGYIPALITGAGSRYLGLPSAEVTRAFFAGGAAAEVEEGAFCAVKPRERVLVVADKDAVPVAHMMGTRYDVLCAVSGDEARALCVGQNPPDLVVMDADLAAPSGFETCRSIRAHPASSAIPVLLFAAERSTENELRAFDAGASDFVGRPLVPEVLSARARVLLRLKRTTDLLEQFSRLDGLTEIPNRREFDRTLEREWLRALRTGKPLSLIMCDVDYFKRYNDHFGHLEGDQCLKSVAAVIERTLRRPQDVLARYGGEEFAVILPETDVEGAVAVAQAVRSAMHARALPHVEGCVTLSFGVGTAAPKAGQQPRALIAAADAALYRAKSAGRDCVIAQPPNAETQ